MAKAVFILLISSFCFFSCTDTITNNEQEENLLTTTDKKVASASDKFGLKLFQEINKAESAKNIFISPLSISAALGMTLNGANGDTYEAMKSVLEFNGLSEDEINNSYKTLFKYLLSADPKIILSIANSIWHTNDLNVEQQFISRNKDYFNSSVTGMDFTNPECVNIINGWVKNNTMGLIDKVLDRIPPEAVMYLINAIYFKGSWTYTFDKSATAADKFFLQDGSETNCQLMNQRNTFEYFRNDEFQAIRLPYGEGIFSMSVFLPAQDKNIDELITQFTTANYEVWNSSFVEKAGNLWLPKFKTDYELQMKDVLTTLGMGIAFTNAADFRRISALENLAISSVLHKSFVDVNEEGTEAAAVTVVEIGRTSIGDEDKEFNMKVNRPFIFVISEKESGSILFIGKIIKP